MIHRVYEIIPSDGGYVVLSYLPDDSGGEYDVHEMRFYSRERAEEYIKTMRKVEDNQWPTE
jgi:hypothetical protein